MQKKIKTPKPKNQYGLLSYGGIYIFNVNESKIQPYTGRKELKVIAPISKFRSDCIVLFQFIIEMLITKLIFTSPGRNTFLKTQVKKPRYLSNLPSINAK